MHTRIFRVRLTAKIGRFVGSVAAVVFAVAKFGVEHAQLGRFALEFRLGTVPAVGIPRRATDLVAKVSAVPVAVATEVRRDAMAALALERAVLALEPSASELVRIVAAIVVVIAPPLARYALAVGTLELGFRTLPVQPLAHVLGLVRVVAAIVFEIAQPPFRYAPVVLALEVRGRLAFRAVLGQFVRTVPAIVLAVAEQPLGYAPVVRPSRTSLPAGRAVPLPAHVRRFVGIVTAIVVEIAHPQFRYATSVLARVLGFRVALSVVCNVK